MKNIGRSLAVLLLAGFLAAAMTSCNDSGSEASGTGRLSIELSDAPAADYQAVYVTIAEVQVHRAGAQDGRWQTILTPNTTYNLLDLVNGATAHLGVADLQAGAYTQMRLILGDEPDATENLLGNAHPYANYLIDEEGQAIKLWVPSGFQTGIKLVHGFEVEAGLTAGLLLDFDAGHSIVKAGRSGKWLLKPTIRVVGILEYPTLSGLVTDESGNPVAGATVSLQAYDPGTDRVTLVQGTITSSEPGHEGEYLMYLEPGTYAIVAARDGFNAACSQLSADYGMDYTRDFTLTAAPAGEIELDLTLPSDTSDLSAAIEFRQTTVGYGTIVVKDEILSESGTYRVSLPEGTYTIVAGCDDMDDIVIHDVADGQSVSIDFTLQP